MAYSARFRDRHVAQRWTAGWHLIAVDGRGAAWRSVRFGTERLQ